jgi:farnesyl-diphosphate farnesyltransferase
MPTPNPSADFDALLRGVSRSFYLSIRLLPGRLRWPVGLAYLLARATDTVGDTVASPVEQRRMMLALLAQSIDQARPLPGLATLASEFALYQTEPDERELILRLGGALDALNNLHADDLHDVRTVLRHITEGQASDLTHFSDVSIVRALPDAAALHHYTYQVAGCVGEFWTDLCLRHLRDYSLLPAPQLRALGRSFGCGLQLVNIVRDLGSDLAAGRCYLPADELAAIGIHAAQLRHDPERCVPVWQAWQGRAARAMQDGMAYALAVHPRRVRAAVALPAMLGARTVSLVRAAGPAALHDRVKVPRREVHAMLARTVLSLAGRHSLRSQFETLRGESAASQWDNPPR